MSDQRPPSGGPEPPYQGQPPPPPPGPDQLSAPVPPPRRHRRGLILTAVAVVAALAIGGGAYAVVASLSSGTDEAARHLPADTLAVASVNLDPGGGESLAALKFLRNFPSIAAHSSGLTLGDGLLRPIFESSGTGVNFDRDIKPWIGDHLALAADPQGDRAHPVAAIQSTDDPAAKAGLARLAQGQHRFGYVVSNGYAIVSDSPAAAQRASADAAQSALGATGTYSSDVAALPAGAIATGWVDVHAALAFAARTGATSPGQTQTAKVPARLAMSVRFDTSVADVRIKAFGTSGLQSGDVGSTVSRLPADTAVAIGASHLDSDIRSLYSVLRRGLGARAAGPLTSFETQSGLTLPGDLVALVGSKTVFALGGPDLSSLGLLAITTDRTHAAAAAAKVNSTLTGGALVVRQTAHGLVIASSDQYAAALQHGGSLGAQSLYRTAVPDAGHAAAVVYLDLGRIIAKQGNASPDVKALKAFGLTASVDGGTATLRMRLVVG